MLYIQFGRITPQITGDKKQSDEGAAFFGVRVHLPCWTKPLSRRRGRANSTVENVTSLPSRMEVAPLTGTFEQSHRYDHG